MGEWEGKITWAKMTSYSKIFLKTSKVVIQKCFFPCSLAIAGLISSSKIKEATSRKIV